MTKLDAPATGRNRAPILSILERWLVPGPRLRLLEIASGTGQHAVHFAQALPHVDWQPSDPDADSLASIAAWREDSRLANLAAPIRLDVRDADWGVARVDAIFNANMIHISPWSAAEGLFAGAGRLLETGGLLFLYGPFFFADRPTAPSNAAFDASLRRRDAEWGVRDFERVVATAARAALAWVETNDLPANNVLLVFRRERVEG